MLWAVTVQSWAWVRAPCMTNWPTYLSHELPSPLLRLAPLKKPSVRQHSRGCTCKVTLAIFTDHNFKSKTAGEGSRSHCGRRESTVAFSCRPPDHFTNQAHQLTVKKLRKKSKVNCTFFFTWWFEVVWILRKKKKEPVLYLCLKNFSGDTQSTYSLFGSFSKFNVGRRRHFLVQRERQNTHQLKCADKRMKLQE